MATSRRREVQMAKTLAELRAAEREVAREGQWLHDTLNGIARVHAERSDGEAFRRMQTQAKVVGQRHRALQALYPAGRSRRTELTTRTAIIMKQPHEYAPEQSLRAAGPNATHTA